MSIDPRLPDFVSLYQSEPIVVSIGTSRRFDFLGGSAMSELYWKPAHELAALIRNRELKPSELIDLTIKRIEQTNPKLNAFCALRADQALKEARARPEIFRQACEQH